MTKKLKYLCSSAILLTLTSGTLNASTYIIDQQNDSLNAFQGYTTGGNIMGQSFSPTANWLDHVELQLNSQSTVNTASAYLNIMDSPTGTILGSSNTLTFTGTALQVAHFEFAPIDTSGYSSLFISVVKDSTTNVGAFLAGGFGANSYAGGQAYLDGTSCCSGFQPDSDLWFRTGSVVPIPAAIWLFGSGLLGMFAMARRKA